MPPDWLDSRRHPVLLVALLLAVVLGSSAGAPATEPATAAEKPAADANWSLVRDDDGIEVFTRSVPGSAVKEFRGVGIVDADPDGVLAVLADGDHFFQWFPNCPESAMLQRKGHVTYQYTVMEAPWPIDDRDNIFRSVTERDDATGTIRIALSAAPDFRPERDGRMRVRKAGGYWALEPTGARRTRVVFQMHLDPGGGVPAWMANARVVSTPYEAIHNLRERVRR